MINLLPPGTKKQISAARVNVILVRYTVIMGFALGFLVLACATSYFIIDISKPTDGTPVVDSEPKKTSNEASTFRTNLSIAKNILDQQISYSTIISSIAAALPTGTILKSLSLSNSSIGTPTTIEVHARTAESEPTLKENLQKSSLFSNYTLQSTTTDKVGSPEYPVTFTIGITINKGSA